MDRVSDRDEIKEDMGDGINPGIGLGTLTWVKEAFFIHHSSQTNTPALCLLDHKTDKGNGTFREGGGWHGRHREAFRG